VEILAVNGREHLHQPAQGGRGPEEVTLNRTGESGDAKANAAVSFAAKFANGLFLAVSPPPLSREGEPPLSYGFLDTERPGRAGQDGCGSYLAGLQGAPRVRSLH
jgi:hypothetical protein